MKKTEHGFNLIIVLVISVLIFATLSFIFVQRQSSLETEKIALKSTSRTGTYKFHDVSVKMNEEFFTPFIGFSFHAPANWAIRDSGGFGYSRISGQISNPQYSASKTTTLYSPILRKVYREGSNNNEPVAKGARIVVTMYQKNPATTPPTDPCKAFRDEPSGIKYEAIDTGIFRYCQSSLNTNQYGFNTETSKFYYSAELNFDTNAIPEVKDYYISAARDLVKGFQLY